jgi:hypothetical protein
MISVAVKGEKMQLKNNTYNFLRDLAQIWIPGAAVLYSSIAGLWGLPDVTQVVGSLVAVDTFLGVGLKISSAMYTPDVPAGQPTHGTITLDQTGPGGDTVAVLGFDEPDRDKLMALLASKQAVTFKINKVNPPPLSVVQDPPALVISRGKHVL